MNYVEALIKKKEQEAKNSKTVVITIRLNSEDYRDLQELVAKVGESQNWVVSKLISVANKGGSSKCTTKTKSFIQPNS